VLPAGGLASNQNTSAFPESPSQACFRGKVIILDVDHNAVLDAAPPSVLPAVGLVSDQSTSAFTESPSQARFLEEVIILDVDHNTVLDTASPSSFGAEATAGLASNQSTRALPDSPSQGHFCGNVITLDFDRDVVLAAATLQVPKLVIKILRHLLISGLGRDRPYEMASKKSPLNIT
jgi:hypothetical protein